jgi:molybdenum cofactor synthesis domain-containing protein
MTRIKIRSLNISEEKGTVKTPVDQIEMIETGVKGDAHAGNWNRQVSLLGIESLKKAEEQNNRKFKFGDFGENITTEGIELHKSNILDRFQFGDVLFEVTQIGKKCHKGCEIMQQTGSCIMPLEGIFCRVLQGGRLSIGDELNYIPKQIEIVVITLSDRASKGIYEDLSGPQTAKLLKEYFEKGNRPVEIKIQVIPDDEEKLEQLILQCVSDNVDIIVTTGGTGIGSRDITPDIVKKLMDKEIPGIMELIRYKYGSQKLNALLSRSVAGTINKSLIYTLPGSVKAVNEYLYEITQTLEHSLRMINDIDSH